MPKYTFLAFTNPTSPDKEAEFNAWYDEHHVPDVLNVPGFVSGRRFRLAKSQFPFNTQEPTHRYLALYEIETDDLAASLNEIVARAGTADMVMIDAMDMSTLNAPVYEEIVPAVQAKDVQRPRRA
ncbi:MAG: hypothetical protein HY749_14430 [Gammaproteobacteria bacterium]|nr:hypothetical protein [Gammaproteobacteria bacterium]